MEDEIGYRGGKSIEFPDDAGVVCVTQPPYNARGDGIHDDTEAINRALHAFPNQGAIIYLPDGEYRISDTLTWPAADSANEYKNTILQGQSRDGVTIRLEDECNGFGDVDSPKPCVWTGHKPAQRFRNAIRNCTVSTGRNNPGAIGIRFIANNQGCIRHVRICSDDNNSHIGLDMGFTDEIGPLLVKYVEIEGFNTGIYTAFVVDSMCFEHVRLLNNHSWGIYNDGQSISVRKLTVRGSPCGLYNRHPDGCVVMIESRITADGCDTPALAAIHNRGTLFVRDIFVCGYKMSILNDAGTMNNSIQENITEFVSHEVKTPHPQVPARSLRLAVRETPDVACDELDKWVSPTHFGARPGSGIDCADAVQKAIDSGGSTLYFPRGSYTIEKPVIIRGAIKRITGCEAAITTVASDEPIFYFTDGVHPCVVLERMQGDYTRRVSILHEASRELIIQSCCDISCHMRGSGNLFVEDVCSNPHSHWEIRGQSVWARQLNPENNGCDVDNQGGTLWILGFKTERFGPLLRNSEHARTEILGGFFYATTGEKEYPCFENRNSDLSVTMAEACFTRYPFISIVKETGGLQPGELYITRDEFPRRTENGTVIALYASTAAGSRKKAHS